MGLKRAIVERLARLRLTVHEGAAQVTPVEIGIPWLGFVVYPTHRRVKARNARDFTRRWRAPLGSLLRRHDQLRRVRRHGARLDQSCAPSRYLGLAPACARTTPASSVILTPKIAKRAPRAVAATRQSVTSVPDGDEHANRKPM